MTPFIEAHTSLRSRAERIYRVIRETQQPRPIRFPVIQNFERFPVDQESAVRGAIIVPYLKEQDCFPLYLDPEKQMPGIKRWGFPGGKRKQHDTSIARTAVREFKEETGLDPEKLELTFQYLNIVPIRKTEPTLYYAVFATDLPDGTRIRPHDPRVKIRIADRDELEMLSESGEILPNHVAYWDTYQLYLELQAE